MKSFGCALIWRLAVFLVLWMGVMELAPFLKADFAESNLVSNQIRMQGMQRTPEKGCVILGSSMAARLDPEIITEVSGVPTIQMGLDGGSAKVGLQILNQGGYTPGYLIIEMNALLLKGGANEESLLSQMNEPVFTLAEKLPFVRAQSRPSAVLYNGLKKFKDQRNSAGGALVETDTLPGKHHSVIDGELSALELKWVGEVKSQLEKTKVARRNLTFVMLPNGVRANEREYLLCAKLSRDLGATMLDLKGEAQEGEYKFTDGLHLNLESGKRASGYLGRYLKYLKTAE